MSDLKSLLTDEIKSRLLSLVSSDDENRKWLEAQLNDKAKYDEMLLESGRKSIHKAHNTLFIRGGDIKAVNDSGVLEGYLVAFTDENHRDFYGEYFSSKTEFYLEDYPLDNLRALYNHGLDEAMSVKPIGKISSWHVDERGIYVKAQLDLTDTKERLVYEMAKLGLIGWSSGALPQSVKVDENGQITHWAIIEGSLTPTPAESKYTQITARARGLNSYSASADSLNANSNLSNANTTNKELNTMAEFEVSTETESGDMGGGMGEVLSLLKEIMGMLASSGKMNGMPEEEVKETMLDEMKSYLAKQGDTKKAIDAINANIGTIVESAIRKAMTAHEAKKANVLSALNKVQSEQPAKTATQKVGVLGGNISVSEDLKYAHLSASDMALGIMLASAPVKRAMPNRKVDLRDDLGFSDAYIRHFANKASTYTQSNPYGKRVQDNSALKSAMPIRSNELDASDIATQGQEWVAEWWATDVWRKERDARIYDTLVQKGMMVSEIMRGADTAHFPTEGADPIVYTAPQANDVDATNRPEVTAKINPFGTGEATVTPREIKTAIGVTFILQEDSIVNVIQQANYQLNEKLLETRDQVCINGDTATGANTNINLIDGTPATGLTTPYYIASNGFRKLPLVTNTANSRSAGGSLSISDYLETIKLLPQQLRQFKERLLFIIDADTDMASLALPEIATDDVRRTFATITSGIITNVYGVQVFTSGFLPLANSAGKVPNAGGTLGSILLVYPRYWGFAYKRQITIEQDRDILSGTEVFVASMRMGLTYRSTDAAAITYNVGV